MQEVQPHRGGTTGLYRPFGTGSFALFSFHGLTPAARIVSPLRGWFGQLARRPDTAGAKLFRRSAAAI